MKPKYLISYDTEIERIVHQCPWWHKTIDRSYHLDKYIDLIFLQIYLHIHVYVCIICDQNLRLKNACRKGALFFFQIFLLKHRTNNLFLFEALETFSMANLRTVLEWVFIILARSFGNPVVLYAPPAKCPSMLTLLTTKLAI